MISMDTRTFCILFVAALGLSGCGAADVQSDDDDAIRGGTQFDVLLDEGLAISDALAPLSDATIMPENTTASFDGIASVNWVPAVPDALGPTNLLSRVALNANFTSTGGTIGGFFADFERPSGAQIEGLLAVTSGTIAGNTVSFNLIGQLTGAVEGDIEATAANATFIGDGAQGIDGDLSGTFTGFGLPAVPLDGRFVAARRP